ncbi:SEC-C metal-binding domain-containing protein [Aestuariivirga sp.]|uniref:SEC-C metal-binding domain-containing protein n=1 Tax=Aestuariivirga sp. TaxID=2650926 RepID=UPI0039E29B20
MSKKLHQPDPSKFRNKPCSCGSGIKYKLCCEKKIQDNNYNTLTNKNDESKTSTTSTSTKQFKK